MLSCPPHFIWSLFQLCEQPRSQAKDPAPVARPHLPCLRAPSPARMNEISLESTMWCAPSCRTNRSPESLWPDRGPFSQASRKPWGINIVSGKELPPAKNPKNTKQFHVPQPNVSPFHDSKSEFQNADFPCHEEPFTEGARGEETQAGSVLSPLQLLSSQKPSTQTEKLESQQGPQRPPSCWVCSLLAPSFATPLSLGCVCMCVDSSTAGCILYALSQA